MIPHIGLTITLPGGKTGKVSIFHLSDKYTESPLSDFKIGKVVRSVTLVVLCCSFEQQGLEMYSYLVTVFSLPQDDVRSVRFSLLLRYNAYFLGRLFRREVCNLICVWLKHHFSGIKKPPLIAFLDCHLREDNLVVKLMMGLREVSYPSSPIVLCAIWQTSCLYIYNV